MGNDTETTEPKETQEQQVHTSDLLSAAVNRITEPVLRLIQEDPHQWSTRTCQTCRTISSLIDKPFGCVFYAQQRKGR